MQPIAPDLWHLEDHIRMVGGFTLPLRTIVWRDGGALTVWSPIALDDARAAAIEALGEVAHLVAPNRLHTKWLGAAAARWPRATVWAPPGVRDGARRLDQAELPGVDTVPIAGAPRVDETVFFHRGSRTLICADLLFHVAEPANLRTRFILWCVGASRGRFVAGREWRVLVRDRAAAAASVARLLELPTERVVMAHGAIVDDGARDALGAARLSRLGRPALRP